MVDIEPTQTTQIANSKLKTHNMSDITELWLIGKNKYMQSAKDLVNARNKLKNLLDSLDPEKLDEVDHEYREYLVKKGYLEYTTVLNEYTANSIWEKSCCHLRQKTPKSHVTCYSLEWYVNQYVAEPIAEEWGLNSCLMCNQFVPHGNNACPMLDDLIETANRIGLVGPMRDELDAILEMRDDFNV